MNKRAGLILFVLISLLADFAYAQQTVRLVTLPFEIYAQDDLSYLEKDIPIAIKNQLEKEGAEAVILGCTDLPILLSQVRVGLPLVDTMGILEDVAVEHLVS